MKNRLLSAAIGDIAGSAYEHEARRIKEYDKVKMFSSRARFTDDTVLTFACAQALSHNLDMTTTLWIYGNLHPKAGYGKKFKEWMNSNNPIPTASAGNGVAMRCSAAGWLAASKEECINMATATAAPTHNHPDGFKAAVATALSIYYLKIGKGKRYVRENTLKRYYPAWAELSYKDIHDTYNFTTKAEKTVPAAIICFLESKSYYDCIKLAIALGGDSDTLAAIAGPMAYAYYKEIPQDLVDKAYDMLPEWMKKVNEDFDKICETLDSNIKV